MRPQLPPLARHWIVGKLLNGLSHESEMREMLYAQVDGQEKKLN
jgi:hypothetical protein